MTDPYDRDKIIAKVRDVIEIEIRKQGDEPGGGYVGTGYSGEHSLLIDGGIDLTPVATAAFDALIEAWGPPW
ncbi:hypothetical protein BTO20_11390 [Mycobacterium dioxanotrophicus]|uniref:Uncharacterized protein n=1 Tax=Mycobacterium dioxanotrophicus TaxID=482462 RepID=A0A1Y0C1W4_9MYCO|nr:hypothetical protein [Mycobacterium dioxanotrophicus]ART69107.1 hypothetical protein BTO20_11390 [Mycobacterium dioxanotrophicus]